MISYCVRSFVRSLTSSSFSRHRAFKPLPTLLSIWMSGRCRKALLFRGWSFLSALNDLSLITMGTFPDDVDDDLSLLALSKHWHRTQ
jgi:hypothetical protein